MFELWKAQRPTPASKPSEALQIIYDEIKARRMSDSGKRVGHYVCHDLDNLLAAGRITKEACDLAVNHISELLAPNITINAWLVTNHPEIFEAVAEERDANSEAWYEYKAAWVADMIAYWKEQGL